MWSSLRAAGCKAAKPDSLQGAGTVSAFSGWELILEGRVNVATKTARIILKCQLWCWKTFWNHTVQHYWRDRHRCSNSPYFFTLFSMCTKISSPIANICGEQDVFLLVKQTIFLWNSVTNQRCQRLVFLNFQKLSSCIYFKHLLLQWLSFPYSIIKILSSLSF